MTYTKEDCKRDTIEHIDEVGKNINKIIQHLIQRRAFHDASKLEDPELSIFTKFTPKLKTTVYGSGEYKGFTKAMKDALDHHYANNRHHTKHFKAHECNGCFKAFKTMPDSCDVCGYSQFTIRPDISQMNLVDIMEMFCDWLAATKRHDDGDIYKSIEHNSKEIGALLSEIFENTAREIFSEGLK